VINQKKFSSHSLRQPQIKSSDDKILIKSKQYLNRQIGGKG